MEKEIRDLITVGKQTNKLIIRLSKILTILNIVNVITIIVIGILILR